MLIDIVGLGKDRMRFEDVEEIGPENSFDVGAPMFIRPGPQGESWFSVRDSICIAAAA